MEKINLTAIIAIIVSGAVVAYTLYRVFNLFTLQTPTTKTTLTPKPLEPLPLPQLQVLENINQNILTQIPQGQTDDRLISVTDTVQMITDDAYNGLNWMQVDLYNNGPSSVHYSINTKDRAATSLLPNESISIDLKQRGAIKKIYLFCDTGNTTTVSLHGLI